MNPLGATLSDAEASLKAAIDEDNVSKARAALAQGADPCAVADGRRSLIRHALNGHDLIAAGIIRTCKLLVDRQGPLLPDAHRYGAIRTVELLLALGANPNEQPGILHLGIGASGKHAQTKASMIKLLAAGADPNSRDPTGKTVLQVAVETAIFASGSPDADYYLTLLENKADPAGTSTTGRPLVMDLFHNDPTMVHLVPMFLEYGAEPNAKDLDGKTLLQKLLEGKHYRGACAAMEKGADPFAADPTGVRPFDVMRAQSEALDRGGVRTVGMDDFYAIRDAMLELATQDRDRELRDHIHHHRIGGRRLRGPKL